MDLARKNAREVLQLEIAKREAERLARQAQVGVRDVLAPAISEFRAVTAHSHRFICLFGNRFGDRIQLFSACCVVPESQLMHARCAQEDAAAGSVASALALLGQSAEAKQREMANLVAEITKQARDFYLLFEFLAVLAAICALLS